MDKCRGLGPDKTPTAEYIFDVTDYGAIPDDGNDDYNAIEAAITAAKNAPGISIVYFPAGTYNINSTINLSASNNESNIIFQGEGANNSILEFNVGASNRCFYIHGENSGNPLPLDADIPKGSNEIYANDLNSNFDTGDWIHFYENNFPGIESDFQPCIGQITQIENINGNSGIIKDKASKYYSTGYDLLVEKITSIRNVGIEKLKIKRIDTGYESGGENIYFDYALYCWVKAVESSYTSKNHIVIRRSSQTEVIGCYLHHARFYGDHGFGYGVLLEMSSTNCLIENNIFKHLRHSIVVQGGANCNVITYNYSREQYATYYGIPFSTSDVRIHGNYPYSNLFEHNFVKQIEADNEHENNGPYNVFLRNALCVIDGGEYYWRKLILNNSPYTGVLSCELYIDFDPIITDENSNFSIDLYGKLPTENYETAQTISHHNLVFWMSYLGNMELQDISYYYSQKPDFLNNNYSFPSIGPEFISHNIPAKDRYNSSIKTDEYRITQYVNTPPSAPVLSISGSLGEHPTLSWTDGGEPDIDHFVLKKDYTNENGTLTQYVDPAPNPYIDTFITIDRRGNTVAEYQVKAVDKGELSSFYSNEVSTIGLGPAWKPVVHGENNNDIPKRYEITGIFPNPFNPLTTIHFSIPEESKISIDIYNLLGVKVRTLYTGTIPAGYHTLKWYGRDHKGNQVSSGVYLVHFQATSLETGKIYNQSMKCVLKR